MFWHFVFLQQLISQDFGHDELIFLTSAPATSEVLSSISGQTHYSCDVERASDSIGFLRVPRLQIVQFCLWCSTRGLPMPGWERGWALPAYKMLQWQASQTASGNQVPTTGLLVANIWRLTGLLWADGAQQLGKAIHQGEGGQFWSQTRTDVTR
jgi:hypothetical protein